MRIAEMSPISTTVKVGRSRTVGNWSFDDYAHGGNIYREVYHYSTLMVRWVCRSYPYNGRAVDGWTVEFVSLGHGTVSDQGGLNQLLRPWGMSMRRDARGGGPRIVRH